MYDLPAKIIANGNTYHITNKCDYRVMIDLIVALDDADLSDEEKTFCALIIGFEEFNSNEDIYNHYDDIEILIKELFLILNGGEESHAKNQLELYNWKKDFKYIISPINKIFARDIRADTYLHWYSFLSAFSEIGECTFSHITNLRKKQKTGKKLEKHEREYIKENKHIIDLPKKYSTEEKEFFEELGVDFIIS